jgi:hypothetical protein
VGSFPDLDPARPAAGRLSAAAGGGQPAGQEESPGQQPQAAYYLYEPEPPRARAGLDARPSESGLDGRRSESESGQSLPLKLVGAGGRRPSESDLGPGAAAAGAPRWGDPEPAAAAASSIFRPELGDGAAAAAGRDASPDAGHFPSPHPIPHSESNPYSAHDQETSLRIPASFRPSAPGHFHPAPDSESARGPALLRPDGVPVDMVGRADWLAAGGGPVGPAGAGALNAGELVDSDLARLRYAASPEPAAGGGPPPPALGSVRSGSA